MRPLTDDEGEAEETPSASDNSESRHRDYDKNHADGLSPSESDTEPDATVKTLKQITFRSLARAQEALSKDNQGAIPPFSQKNSIEEIKSQRVTLEDLPAVRFSKAQKSVKQSPRESKNAPPEMSAKRAVTRKRKVIAPLSKDVQKARDPRFDPAVGGRLDQEAFRRNYTFLDDYRADEVKRLEQDISATGNSEIKEQLKKKLTPMQSKKETQRKKAAEKDIIKHHRKKEREAVKTGKKAFHLKRADVKKKVFFDQFANLNEKQLEKIIQRKQKRKVQKERKKMPFSRRASST